MEETIQMKIREDEREIPKQSSHKMLKELVMEKAFENERIQKLGKKLDEVSFDLTSASDQF